jgi:hypothetical protein
MGYEKNISDKEGEQLATAVTSGGDLGSIKDSTFGEIAVAMQNNPEKMLGSIQRMSAGISSTYGSRMSSNADVGYYGGQRPLIYVTEPTERTRDEIVRDTFKARGAKEDVSAQSTPNGKAEAIVRNIPFVATEGYDGIREVVKNTMDLPLKEQLERLDAAKSALPEGSPSRRKADALEKVLIQYKEGERRDLGTGVSDRFDFDSKKKASGPSPRAILEREIGKL